MRKTVVLNVVGLTPSLIGDATPRLRQLVARGRLATIREVTPAVTCAAQATSLTGRAPRDHGIVGNGWYFRDTCEVRFWHQSNKLVQAPLLWDVARQRDARFTCANVNWWFAMYSTADHTVTPRPQYPADGRKLPDCWTHPPQLRDALQRELGTFPLFKYWGPATSIDATRWLASAAIAIDERFDPTLTLVYLPHLDYELQRLGPRDVPNAWPPVGSDAGGVRYRIDSAAQRVARAAGEVDAEVGRLVDHFDARGANVVVLSEYGIAAVERPVHLNRALRAAGYLAIREERGRELLDAGASRAFAVADHQLAHVYVRDPHEVDAVAALLRETPGVGSVHVGRARGALGLDHPRAGEVVALAAPGAWFTYYYWLDDARAPDFARTVDIHRKPGYDPAELFFDPALRAPRLKVASTLLRRRLGARALLDVIGLDASIVRGSHGLPAASRDGRPVFISDHAAVAEVEIDALDVCDLLLAHLDLA